MNFLRRTIQIAVTATVVAVVVQELQKPPEQRTWQGKAFGWVPYDLRYPWIETEARLRAAYWNPGDERLLTGNVFGIGWGINLPVLWRRCQEVLALVKVLLTPG